MTNDWKVKKHRGQCATTGVAFMPGDTFYSAIIDEDGVFKRLDFTPDAFDDVRRKQAFSYWKSHVPLPDDDDTPRHQLVDVATLTEFFRKLTESGNDEHAGFLYLIALLLMRKKIFIFKDITFDGDIEWLILQERKTKAVYRIRDPHLSPDQLGTLRASLSELFESPEMFEQASEQSEDNDSKDEPPSDE